MIDTANNRFTTGQGYTYDLSGNLLTDAEGRSFSYDAENKQKEAKNVSNQTVGLYFYDGDGKRVKKMTNSETVIFVYDAIGKLVAEYSTQLSQTPQTQYLTNDNLGTPRINTDQNGAVVSRSDYMPYGEEITGLGGRSSTDRYVEDDVRQGFTGYIKDDETGLDFAEARMYKKELGRFTGVDKGTFTPADPQNFNRYVYVQNNPLKFVDPTGLDLVLTGKQEDVDAAVALIEQTSGYKLKHMGKGKYVIDEKVDRKKDGTSSSFAELLKKVTDKDYKGVIAYEVKRDADKTLFDNFFSKKIDMNDIDALKSNAPELAKTFMAHVIAEGDAAIEQDKEPGNKLLDENAKYTNAHEVAKRFDAKVLGELTGTDQGTERSQDKKAPKDHVVMQFKTLQYDIQLKSGVRNTSDYYKIVSVTKTEIKRK
jgi:RHS repeat-associated protein